MTWRVGKRVPINVYKDDAPVCQCQTPELAAEIVRGMNAMAIAGPFSELAAERDQLRAQLAEATNTISGLLAIAETAPQSARSGSEWAVDDAKVFLQNREKENPAC